MDLETQNLNRSFDDIQVRALDDDRSVELAFSSELPYLRSYGYEILSHREGAVDMSRLINNAPLLADHNTSDQIGVVTSARIDDDGIGRAVVKFSRSQRGQDFLNDVKDGIRQKISVGYSVDIERMELEETRDGIDTYRFESWAPYEISVVSVPADDSVGIGRNLETQEKDMSDETIVVPSAEEPTKKVEISVNSIDVEAERAAAVEAYKAEVEVERVAEEAKVADETKRVDEITTLGEAHKQPELARTHIQMGSDPQDAANAILNTYTTGERSMDQQPTLDLGLTQDEARSFSFVKAARAMANPTDKKLREDAAFEFDVSAAHADLAGKEARGIWIPNEVTRANTVGSNTGGGNLVETDLMAESFIDLLRNKSAMLGKTTELTGLVGNVTVPRQTGTATVAWVAENGSATESSPTFDQISLSPKTLTARTQMSRRAMIQTTPDIEKLVRTDLARAMGLGWDLAILNGSGASNQPTGVLNTSGIVSLTNGTRTNGKALDWDDLVKLWEIVAAGNADADGMEYIFNAAIVGKALTTQKFSSSNGSDLIDGLSYPFTMSNQLASTGTKGTGTALSTMIFGNFKDVVTGMWSGMDMVVDPYSNTNGSLEIRVFQDADVAVRHKESFAIAKDVITA